MPSNISLCFICDEHYVMPTVVAITSVITNKNRNDTYDIYIVTNNISKNSIGIFKNLANDHCNIITIETGRSEKFDTFRMDGYWVTTTDLFKFELPDLLPSDLEKVLYLDGDIIVQKDLAPVFQESIDDVYAGVIKDYFVLTCKGDFQKRLNINHKAYFNAGVLLLNLKKMREDNIPVLLLQYRSNHTDMFMDQDTYNVVLQENVRYLSFYYNFQYTCWLCDKKELTDYYNLEAVDTKYTWIRNAIILHYTWLKPWQYFDYFAADIWLHYYLLSPFKDVPLIRESFNEQLNTKQEKKLKKLQEKILKLQKENNNLLKKKAELEKIKKSNGYKTLIYIYQIRDALMGKK